jgi:uncharacterized membrane protein
MLPSTPWLHVATLLAFALHIGGGGAALISGLIAIFAPKGGWLHRRAGTVFFVSMLVMAVSALWLAAVMPGQTVNLFIATFTFYLVATGWLTVRRPQGQTGWPERIALLIILCLCAPFAVLSFQLTTGMTPFFKSAVAFEGPVLIAIYGFTFVTVLATLADLKVAIMGGISGAPRIARHLWRMGIGLTLAAGSAFTNGFARFLPGPYHVPRVFFLPQLLLLALTLFWVLRVRLTNWYKRG